MCARVCVTHTHTRMHIRWVSWAPFVGMFIAIISRGRTIRQVGLPVLQACNSMHNNSSLQLSVSEE